MLRKITKILCGIIIVLACIYLYKYTVERFVIIDKVQYDAEYDNLFYYSNLDEEQKKIYIYCDKAINSMKNNIEIGLVKNDNIDIDIKKAIDAIYKDKPEYYFLPKEYNTKIIDLYFCKYAYIEMDYDVENVNERHKKDLELENAIQSLLTKCITPGMTDIEKEMAIHDELLNEVTYYEYTDINNIPNEKHTAYGALVEKEAVCDGISKAMMILLNRVDVQTILTFGQIEQTPHAWNIVNISNQYYHLDATLDIIDFNSQKHIMHNYFNIKTEDIYTTHTMDEPHLMPECIEDDYNYYTYNNYVISNTKNIRSQLKAIIADQSKFSILEVKLSDKYSSDQLIEALYFLDFSNWNTEGKQSVSYHKNDELYVFQNSNNVANN